MAGWMAHVALGCTFLTAVVLPNQCITRSINGTDNDIDAVRYLHSASLENRAMSQPVSWEVAHTGHVLREWPHFRQLLLLKSGGWTNPPAIEALDPGTTLFKEFNQDRHRLHSDPWVKQPHRCPRRGHCPQERSPGLLPVLISIFNQVRGTDQIFSRRNIFLMEAGRKSAAAATASK